MTDILAYPIQEGAFYVVKASSSSFDKTNSTLQPNSVNFAASGSSKICCNQSCMRLQN